METTPFILRMASWPPPPCSPPSRSTSPSWQTDRGESLQPAWPTWLRDQGPPLPGNSCPRCRRQHFTFDARVGRLISRSIRLLVACAPSDLMALRASCQVAPVERRGQRYEISCLRMATNGCILSVQPHTPGADPHGGGVDGGGRRSWCRGDEGDEPRRRIPDASSAAATLHLESADDA